MHWETQPPFVHCVPAVHVTPQPPQFEGSLVTGMHWLLHKASPAEQPIWQTPAWQAAVPFAGELQ